MFGFATSLFKSRKQDNSQLLQHPNSNDESESKDPRMHIEMGGIGNQIGVNFNEEDFRLIFNDFKTRYDELERISRSDPIIKALLRSVKNPILAASWFIEYEEAIEKNPTELKILEYLNQVIFDDINFKGKKLFEILTLVEHGWSIFEKIFIKRHTKKLGDYISINLPTRLQRTIETFLFADKEHPDRVSHLRQNFSENRAVLVDIPTEKLIVFTNEEIGNDISGKSMLLNCYRPWKEKDLISRMQMIGIERQSIGTPLVNLPEIYKKEDLLNITKQLNGFMAREKGGLFIPSGFEVTILEGKINIEAIDKSLKMKNTEMTLSFLAQFLLLGQFDNGGAYALGRDQSDFFLSSLSYIGNIISSRFNELIIQLVDIQFGKQLNYPKLKVEGINDKASKELAETFNLLTTSGLLTPDEKLKEFIRNIYKFPEMEQDGPAITTPNPNNEDVDQIVPGNDKKLALINEFSIKFQDFKFKENTFVKDITENENFIQDFYSDKYLPVVESTETKLKKILDQGYNNAKIEKRGGVNYIAQTGNTAIKNDMKSKVKDQFAKLKRLFLSDKFAQAIMDGGLDNAENTVKDLFSVTLGFVKQSEVKSFMAGHISNINAVIFNEERRLLENIESNFGNGLSLTVIESQLKVFKLNRNILKLSVTAHPRAIFRGEILRAAQSQGISNFKMLIPTGIKLDPDGKTISLIFLILALLLWEEQVEENQNAGGVVGGLGLHHNSVDYYLPISDDELALSEQLSREQRKKENLDKLRK